MSFFQRRSVDTFTIRIL